MDIAVNMAALERLLAPLPAHTLAAAPEGVPSGYLPEPNFVTRIDQPRSQAAIDRAAQLCRDKQIHLVAGVCTHNNGAWRNTSFYFGPRGGRHRYDKINLAQSGRGTFTPRDTPPLLPILPIFPTTRNRTWVFMKSCFCISRMSGITICCWILKCIIVIRKNGLIYSLNIR